MEETKLNDPFGSVSYTVSTRTVETCYKRTYETPFGFRSLDKILLVTVLRVIYFYQ